VTLVVEVPSPTRHDKVPLDVVPALTVEETLTVAVPAPFNEPVPTELFNVQVKVYPLPLPFEAVIVVELVVLDPLGLPNAPDVVSDKDDADACTVVLPSVANRGPISTPPEKNPTLPAAVPEDAEAKIAFRSEPEMNPVALTCGHPGWRGARSVDRSPAGATKPVVINRLEDY
jgi:hypothetical protein